MQTIATLAMTAALLKLEIAADYRARFPHVRAQNARNYADDIVGGALLRMIDACDRKGDSF